MAFPFVKSGSRFFGANVPISEMAFVALGRQVSMYTRCALHQQVGRQPLQGPQDSKRNFVLRNILGNIFGFCKPVYHLSDRLKRKFPLTVTHRSQVGIWYTLTYTHSHRQVGKYRYTFTYTYSHMQVGIGIPSYILKGRQVGIGKPSHIHTKGRQVQVHRNEREKTDVRKEQVSKSVMWKTKKAPKITPLERFFCSGKQVQVVVKKAI